jgi:integrase
LSPHLSPLVYLAIFVLCLTKYLKMATIKFYLKSTHEDQTAIYARFSYGSHYFKNGVKTYNLFKYYISESINPGYWNPKKCRARESKDFPVYPEFNQKLSDIETTINKVLLSFESESITPTKDELKIKLDKILKPNITIKDSEAYEVKRMDLFQFIDHIIKTSTNKPSTIKSYSVLKKNLTDYQTATGKKLSFRNVDIDFYNSFVSYLEKLGLAKNTIGTRIKVLKTFLSQANEREIKVNTDYQKKSFAKPIEETTAVYLSETELTQMYKLEKLPSYLEKVRDLFLIGCYTGLRFSDLSKLSKENISEENTISIKTQKTGQNVVVPIHPIVRAIFEKYSYQLPRIPSNQKFNEYIQSVAKRAKINEVITTELTKGGFLVSQQTEKYNLVTSHTARRSFATNAYLADMPSISIMKITGHKTESAFMKYIKMSARDNAAKMQVHPFFNKMSIAK